MSKKRTPKEIFKDGAIDPAFIGESIGKHASKHDIGGHEIFLGQVRKDIIEGSEVKQIEFTANRELALEKAFEIREEVFEKFDITCMHIYHSLGLVATGEICFFVFVSSPHRKACREACAYTVDRIKSEVPIFGKEITEAQTEHWKENTL